MKYWTDSVTLRSLFAAFLLHALSWLSLQMAHEPLTWASLDWRYLVSGTIALLLPFVKRLTDPDVITNSPLDFRNPKL